MPDLPLPKVPRQLFLPRDVFFSRHRRRLPVKEAIVAGEEITYEIVEFLQTVKAYGGVLKGASDPGLETIEVMETPTTV